MKQTINGVSVDLKELTNLELDSLVHMTRKRLAEADSDLDKLQAEVRRRDRHDVPMFI